MKSTKKVITKSSSETENDRKEVYRVKVSDDLMIVVKTLGGTIYVYSIYKGNVCTSSFTEKSIGCCHQYWDSKAKIVNVYYPEYVESFDLDKYEI